MLLRLIHSPRSGTRLSGYVHRLGTFSDGTEGGKKERPVKAVRVRHEHAMNKGSPLSVPRLLGLTINIVVSSTVTYLADMSLVESEGSERTSEAWSNGTDGRA